MSTNRIIGRLFPEMEPLGTAIFSSCGTYRYRLTRRWADGPSAVNWLMLNPSKADATEPDPTITRCRNFSRSWGYDGLIVTNLFAFKATDAKVMIAAADPVGPENDRYIQEAALDSSLLVCAWGALGKHLGRAKKVLAMLRDLNVTPHCLKLTSDGSPWHPLYLPGRLTPIPMEISGA